jgi:phospholipid/cholesterol/gamma-HCH transport system ATP-binding protein
MGFLGETGGGKVRVSGLSKGFGGTPVLHDIDLALPTGKSSVLIGPAASGKSVLMKCLIGLYPPDSGTIEIDGRDITRLRGRERAELIETIGRPCQTNANQVEFVIPGFR